MAQKLGDLYVQVSSKGVQQVKGGLTGVEKQANLASKAMNMLKMAIIGIGAYGVLRVFTGMIKLGMTHEKVVAKLNQQLKNHGELTRANTKALLDQADALQKVTQFSNDEIIAAQAMLASFNLTREEIERMTPRMLDVAVMTETTTGTMQDLATTAKMVGVALSGQPGRLTQMGIKLTDLQKELYNAANAQEKFNLLLQIFDDNAKGLAKTVGTTLEGQLKQLKNSLQDIAKDIAKELIPTLKNLVKILKQVTDAYGNIKDVIGKFVNFGRMFDAMTAGSRTLVLGLLELTGVIPSTNRALELMKEHMQDVDDAAKAGKGGIDDLTDAIKRLREESNTWFLLMQRATERQSIFQESLEETRVTFGPLRSEMEVTQWTMEDMGEEADLTADIMQSLGGVFLTFNLSLMSNAETFVEWGKTVVMAIQQVITKLLLLATVSALLSAMGLGGFTKIFKTLAGFGGFQTPRGDWWAYQEGRDFGKFFFQGFNERLNALAYNVNLQQQPVNVIVHTGDPSTFVEFTKKMPTQYKSKFHRHVTIPAQRLES